MTSYPSTSQPLRLEVYRTADELRAFRPSWESLQTHPHADFDVYQAALAEKADTARPYVVCVHADDRPVAMLTSTIEVIEVRLGLAHMTLTRPRMKALLAPFGSLHGNLSEPVAAVLVDHLREMARSGRIDVVRLWDLPTDSAFYREVQRRAPWVCRDHATWASPHSLLTLPATMEEFLTRFRPKHRAAYRKRCRALDGPNPEGLTCFVACEPSHVDRFCRDADAIARKTYQRSLGASFVDSPSTRSRLGLMANKGLWRGYLLYVHEQPCAFWYGTMFRDRFYAVYTGYDPAFAYLNPGSGTTLLLKMIEDLCQNTDVREIDFGPGEEDYKRRFCDRKTADHVWMLHVFAPHLRPVAINLARTLLHGVERATKSLVQSLGLRNRVRRLWRRHLSHGAD